MEQKELIQPHGGLLVERVVREGTERERLYERSQSLARVTLSERAESDLQMIAVGAFSPLRGFMNAEDYRSVIESMRLPNGLAWTIPITLSVSRQKADSLREGTQIALENEAGELLGVLDLSEKYSPDKHTEAERVYGTRDTAHPGVAALFESGDIYLAGDVHVLERPPPTSFLEYRKEPSQTRAYFKEKQWSTIVAFQTRNPIHRAHEYITKCALETTEGLFIHPLVGKTKGDDIPADIRMQCYETLLSHYYPRDRVLLTVYPAAMRYAGPKEAIFHAIARQNYGCSHFIVGRDHAGVGNYYGTYDAQKLFDEFTSEELNIQPMKFENAFFSKVTGQMGTAKTAPGGPETQVNLSGTAVRDMLRAGTLPPAEFSRPEVAQILIKWAQSQVSASS